MRFEHTETMPDLSRLLARTSGTSSLLSPSGHLGGYEGGAAGSAGSLECYVPYENLRPAPPAPPEDFEAMLCVGRDSRRLHDAKASP